MKFSNLIIEAANNPPADAPEDATLRFWVDHEEEDIAQCGAEAPLDLLEGKEHLAEVGYCSRPDGHEGDHYMVGLVQDDNDDVVQQVFAQW